MSKLVMPSGLTEREQADWYFDNREQMADEYLASPASKNPVRGYAARRFGLPVQIEVKGPDAKMARDQAFRKGMTPTQYLETLLHQMLLAEEHQVEPSSAEELRKAS